MGIEILLAFPAVKKVMDLIRFVGDGDVIQWKAIFLTILAWVLGFVLVLLLAASSFAEDLGIAGASWVDAILLGIGLGSAGSALHDVSEGGVTIL